MYTRTENISPLKLFQQIGRSIRNGTSSEQMLKAAVDALGWNFSLDRAVALQVDEAEHGLRVSAEYYREPLKPVGRKHYQLLSGSELYRLFAQGRPVPLSEIHSNASNLQPELGQFIQDTGSKSVLAFPLVDQGTLIGCITIHHCQEDRTFSEEILEIGEAFAEEVSAAMQQVNRIKDKLVDGRVFSHSALPILIVEPGSFRISQTNAAAAHLLDGEENEMRGLPFLELFGETDAARIREYAGKLSPNNAIVSLSNLLAPTTGGQTVSLDATLSTVESDGKREIVVTLHPAAATTNGKGQQAPSTDADANSGRVEELVASLSRQLSWERLTRQIVSKMHSSLDRDTVLQTAADSIGRALRASACLIVRTDSPAASLVTHEYADPNLSPLGLGRSGQLPAGAIANLKQRTMIINDLSNTTKPSGLAKEDVHSLLESGVGALLSTPIAYHGSVYGIIVVQNSDSREWPQQEIEAIETIAQQAAVALSNAQSYALVKDQLFNMNLISNLTQQLTNALDLAGRNARSERPIDPQPMESPTTPLSSRELEVLKLIASGLANREIAQKLFLTESTVELHASRIRKKLKLKSRTALVKYACDNHLV